MIDTKYFANCQTTEELKKTYHTLAMKYHPDLGGDEETFKAINNEYDRLLYAFGIAEDTEQVGDGFKDIINKIIFYVDIKIEICGNWIWVTGNTYTYKTQLKENGFFWASKKQAWYYRPAEYKKARYSKQMGLDEIRGKYGSQTIASNFTRALA